MIKWLFRRDGDGQAARAAYSSIVAQARRPEFYERLGVPDSLDGRFEMIVLHVCLLLRRLKGQGGAAEAFGRTVTEALVSDMDASLRELGVGDLAVPKRIKAMVNGLYGRVGAYEAGLAAEGPRGIEVALENNVYGTVLDSDPALVAEMAGYVRRAAAELARRPVEELVAGRVGFAEPVEPPVPGRAQGC